MTDWRIATGFARGAMLVYTGIQNVGILGTARYLATMLAVRIATLAGVAAQWLLNFALTANPIGPVVVAIAALTAGLIYAYQHNQTFRNIVKDLFGKFIEFVTCLCRKL